MRLRLKLLPMVILLMLCFPIAGSGAVNSSKTATINTVGKVVSKLHKHHKHFRIPKYIVAGANCIHFNYEEKWSWDWNPNFHPHYSYWNGYWTGMQFATSTWSRTNTYLHRHDSAWWPSRNIVLLHVWALVRHDGGWREWDPDYKYCHLPY